MAGKPAVSVTGAAETQRALRRMEDSLTDPATHLRAGDRLRERALDRVPRVSGALADTISVTAGPTGSELVAGSAAVPYAGVINYGWYDRGIEARHFLDGDDMPAIAHDAYAETVGELVERVGRES